MISTYTRYAGATHTEAMGSTILSTTMDPAMKMCRNTQKAVAGNRLDIPNTIQPTMFSQTIQIYCSLPKNTQTMDRCPKITGKQWQSFQIPSNQLCLLKEPKSQPVWLKSKTTWPMWISRIRISCQESKSHLCEGIKKEVVFNLKKKNARTWTSLKYIFGHAWIVNLPWEIRPFWFICALKHRPPLSDCKIM